MRRKYVSVTSGILILVGMIYAYGILRIQEHAYTGNEISPRTFPWLLTALLVLLGISLFIKQWFGSSRSQEKAIECGGIVDGKIIAAVFLLFLYIAGIQSIGFLWTTPFFLGLLSALHGTRSPTLIAGMAMITTIMLHVLLKYLFGVPMP